MNEFFVPNISSQWGALLPYLIVAVGGLLVMVVDSFVRTLKKDHLSYLTMFILIGVVIAQIVGQRADGELLGGMMITGDFTRFFNFLFAGIGVMTTIFATGLYDREGKYRPEFYPLLLFSILGMMMLVAANDLLTIFLGLETMSLATYILVGGVRGNIRSSEAGFKYLILGGFSSAFLLMGMALIYGFAGPDRGTRFGPDAGGLRFQGGDGAVPHVDPRRLRRRPVLRDGFHGHGHQGGRFRDPGPFRHPDAAATGHRLVSRTGGPVNSDDESGQPGGPGSEQHQTHAGLVQCGPCRLPSAGCGDHDFPVGGRIRHDDAEPGDRGVLRGGHPVLPGRVQPDEPGGLRHHQRHEPPA